MYKLAKETRPGTPSPEFGQKLHEWRKEQRLEPSQLARLANVSVQTIYRWERGYAMRPGQLRELERVLIKGATLAPSEAILHLEESGTTISLHAIVPTDQATTAFLALSHLFEEHPEWIVRTLKLHT